MRTARLVTLLAVFSCAASAARAQYPQRRDGFWIGFGLGYGSANITCDNCGRGPRTDGITGFVKLGGTPSRNLLVGGAINTWFHSNSSATEALTSLTASLYTVSCREERILRHGRPRLFQLSRQFHALV